MKKGRRTGLMGHSWLCSSVCLICALLIKPAQDALDSRPGKFRQDPDLIFFNSPALVKKIALGYDGLLADFYWMRTIQYYGRRDDADKRAVRYKNLFAFLDITTTLDPNLLDAYRVGSCFLSEADPVGAGQPRQALKLLDKGIRANPREWRLPYDKGFVYYWYLNDYKAAGEVWQAASLLPEAPYWMASLAAMSLSKGGSIEMATALWEQQYRESTRDDVKKNARNHLLSIQVFKELSHLESMLANHKARTGSYPPSLKDLMREAARAFPIEDPLGTPYEYDPRTGAVHLSPSSTVHYLPPSQIEARSLNIALQ
jgi:tetratricopeptide (TPR) repeat protein